MRVVIQRVSEASVKIEESIVGSIKKGLMVLLGVVSDDTQEDVEWMVRKLTNMRIFDDADGVMNLSLNDVQGDVLLVSQFTLHASTKKGNRPSYIKAAKPDVAVSIYENFIAHLEEEMGKSVQTGQFGADMKVSLINNGPVTIIIDTKDKQ